MQKFRVLSSKKQRKADRSVRVLFPLELYERMRSAFAGSDAASREGYALAQYGHKVDGSRKNWTYMVRSLSVPAKDDLLEQSSITVTPKAEFVEAVLSEASARNNAVMEIHTHVGSREPNFSWVDIENGLENGRFLKSCSLRFAMAVLGTDGFSFCEYDPDHDALQTPESARISTIGRSGMKDVLIHKSHSSCELPASAGPEGVSSAIVGLDGIGFSIAYMLASMGARKFVLYDDGIVGENDADVMPFTSERGKKRTRAAGNMLKKISRDIEVAHAQDIKTALKDCDVIFCCTEDESLRLALNEVSLKYFIPCIEGRTLLKKDTAGLYGYVRVFVPSATGCMGCFNDRPVDTACTGDASRVSVNSVVASMAVQEFMDMASGNGQKSYDNVEYDPATQAIARKASGRDNSCPMCGDSGVLGAGDDKRSRLKLDKVR